MSKGGGGAHLRFNVDSSSGTTERMRITQDGDIGVGTSSPQADLHIMDSGTGRAWSFDGSDVLTMERNGSSTFQLINSNTTSGYLMFSDTDARSQGSLLYDHSNDSMGFRTNASSTNNLTIDSSGQVGIGDNTPSEKLEVNGNAKAQRFIASKYPRLVGMKVNSGTFTQTSPGTGWAPCPYTSGTDELEVTSINVDGPSDVYRVSYAARWTTPSSAQKWTGILIYNSSDTLIDKIHGDGDNATTDFGASGSLIVTGLSAGTYTFKLGCYENSTQDKTFKSERQLMVYRIQ